MDEEMNGVPSTAPAHQSYSNRAGFVGRPQSRRGLVAASQAMPCGICTSTCRSAPTGADTAISSPLSAPRAARRLCGRLLAELALERHLLAPELETVFLGGARRLSPSPASWNAYCGLPGAAEVTVEANPETVTPALAALLRRNGVNRVSLGAQTFQPQLLRVLDRVAGPDDVRSAFYHLRDAGFDNISLDLIYGSRAETLRSRC